MLNRLTHNTAAAGTRVHGELLLSAPMPNSGTLLLLLVEPQQRLPAHVAAAVATADAASAAVDCAICDTANGVFLHRSSSCEPLLTSLQSTVRLPSADTAVHAAVAAAAWSCQN